MRGSIKANLIVFLIIAVIAFCISLTFASLTIHEDNDSYKLMSIEDDSFEPVDVNYVPTYVPKNTTNETNETSTNITYTVENTVDNLTDSDDEWENTYRDWYNE